MRIILFLMLCLCAIPSLAARWISHPTALVIIHVRPGEEKLAESVGRMADQEAGRLAGPLGLTAISSFPIFAYTNRTDFYRDAGPMPLLLGVSYRPSGLIRIDVTGVEGPVRQVLAHEITHSLLNQKLGTNIGSLPSWANEGIAGLLAETNNRQQLAGLAHTRHMDGVMTIDGMESAFATRVNVQIAYAQSRSMLAWLENYHPGALLAMLDEMAVGKSFERALRETTGMTPDKWLEKWQAGIPAYQIWLNLLTSPVLFSPAALVIMVIAIIRLRRKQTEEYDDDEMMDDDDDDQPIDPLPPPRVTSRSFPELAQYPIWDDLHS